MHEPGISQIKVSDVRGGQLKGVIDGARGAGVSSGLSFSSRAVGSLEFDISSLRKRSAEKYQAVTCVC